MTAATNDFLAVAIAGTPNVQPQGDYAGSTEQIQGFALNEIPTSPQWNKMLRQATYVASCLAQLIPNNLAENAVDDGNSAEFIALLNQLFPPATGGRLQYVNATTLLLAPFNGGFLWINGANYPIPAACTLANSGLVAQTDYFIYAHMSSASPPVMTLEASATGYTANTGNGMPQKNGDPTRTLVGRIFTSNNTPGQFVSTVIKQNVATFFNRRNNSIQGNANAGSISGGSAAEIQSSNRVEAVLWADEGVFMSGTGSLSYAAAISTASCQLGISSNNGVSFSAVGVGVTGTVDATYTEQASGFTYSGNLPGGSPTEGHYVFTALGFYDTPANAVNATIGVYGLVRN